MLSPINANVTNLIAGMPPSNARAGSITSADYHNLIGGTIGAKLC